MTASFPRVSSWPPLREEDDGLDPLGPAGRKAVHKVSRAPMPSSSAILDTGAPSIVISPQAEVPVTPARPRKRIVEPTLVVRDKHQVDALRAGIRRIARSRARRKVLTVLTWGGASALAFGLGTALAFFAATSGRDKTDSVDDSPFAAPVVAKGDPDPVRPAAGPERRGQPDAARPASAPAASAVVSLEDLGDEAPVPAPAPRVVRASAPVTKAPSAPAPAAKPAPAPAVISLEDL